VTVEAITFDGDGTLWDFETAMRRALEWAAQRFRCAGADSVTAGWLSDVRDEVASRVEYRTASMETIRYASFIEAIRRRAPDRLDLAEDIYSHYMTDRFGSLDLYPEVREVLAELGVTYRLALVTNGNTRPERLGLERLLPVSVVAADQGVRKPDPAIYRLAADRLGVPINSCLHVGDDPWEDVVAAREAGMSAVWMLRTGAEWPEAFGATPPIIRSLSELPALITAQSGKGS
jgi:2-haloalkanoic acid dehalogenase type II